MPPTPLEDKKVPDRRDPTDSEPLMEKHGIETSTLVFYVNGKKVKKVLLKKRKYIKLVMIE